MRHNRQQLRPGGILPMTALCLVGICAFMAMAIDLGILAAARTQCQNAADGSSLASTRVLDNKPSSVNSNRSNAEVTLDNVVVQNRMLSSSFSTSNIQKRYGVYDYDTSVTPPRFAVTYPGTPPVGRSWTATESTVSGTFNTFFGRISGLDNAGTITGVNSLTTAARAVSVYRPRDIAMVLDMSGSMKFGCYLSDNGLYLSNDPVIPKMSHYQRYDSYITTNPNNGATGSTFANRHNPLFTTKPYVRPDTQEVYAPSNVTVENAGGPPVVKDFFYDASNLLNPTNSVSSPNPNTAAVAPATPLPRAFHHWDPTVQSPNDPDNYLPATLNYSGWNSVKNINNYILYPTPDGFGDQTDPNLIGDKWPRKSGAEWKTTPGTWDPTAADGAAINLAEYLGWINKYTGGAVPSNNSLPTPTINNAAAKVNKTTFGNPTAPNYQANWRDFRDATWEKYGYDLDVNTYVNTRPADWDPGIDPDQPPPVNPTDVRGYPAGDARRVWWDSVKATIVQPGRYKGYTMGPGYWGKSFFIWPPDPRTPSDDSVPSSSPSYVAGDWRIRFLFDPNWTRLDVNGFNGSTATTRNNVSQATLRNGNGDPTGFWAINYSAILKWIKSPPLALPPNLRAGRVQYYTSIPDDVDTSTGSPDQIQDKRFWRAYIDFTMKNTSTSAGQYMCGHETRGWPEGAGNTTHSIFQGELGQYDVDGTGERPADPRPYTNYLDNPSRPRHHMWFGPHSMLAFLNAENSWAGTVHETQTWQLKAGVNSVLDDIRNNHPNDAVGLCYFSAGGYGFTSVGCSQDFELLKASLFYPKELVDNGKVWTDPRAEFKAFDASMNWRGNSRVQNAQGGTDPQIGMAVAFNILAPSTHLTLPALPPIPGASVQVNGRPVATQAVAGRRGRRGASKVVVFETDGVPNNTRTANYQAAGYNSYYTIATNSGSGGDPYEAPRRIIDQMRKNTAITTAGDSGLSLPNNKAKVYSIGFGDLFGLTTNSRAIDAKNFLLTVQQRGGTSAAGDSAIPSYQIITGAYQTRIDSLRQAFERILQSGVQVTLIE